MTGGSWFSAVCYDWGSYCLGESIFTATQVKFPIFLFSKNITNKIINSSHVVTDCHNFQSHFALNFGVKSLDIVSMWCTTMFSKILYDLTRFFENYWRYHSNISQNYPSKPCDRSISEKWNWQAIIMLLPFYLVW